VNSTVERSVQVPDIVDASELRARYTKLVSDDLIIFPVRHHSPACALQIQRLFERVPIAGVLIEGPRSFTSLIPLLADAETQAPVAIYTYAVLAAAAEQPVARRSAFYPFCDYSPEFVAMREAKRRGVPARFIDLDFAEQCMLDPQEEEGEQASLLDERHYRHSRHLKALAARLGCRDFDELWEVCFEVSPLKIDLPQFVAQVATYCHLARLDATDAELAADGTLQREAEMAFHVRSALKERSAAGAILVVVGGYHAVVLPDLLADEGARPNVSRGRISDESSALVRYSYDRLDRLNGYSAGMTSPAWHQDVWSRAARLVRSGPGEATVRRDAALAKLTEVAVELRERCKLPVPLPSLAAAYEQALRLAALRNRPAPVRNDVLDAITSCFVKGDADADGALIASVARRAFSGTALGRVPAGAGTPPLVRDFEYRARRQRLKIDDTEPRRCALDIYRRPEHRVTSRLLHGLSMLGVPFARRAVGPDFVNGTNLDRLREEWEYQYSPLTEGSLVEASLFGTTIPAAVANRFVAYLEDLQGEGKGRDARAGADAAVKACVLGLHDHLPRVLATLKATIGEDANFGAVSAAARTLGLMIEAREPLEAHDVTELPALLQAAYERAVYLGRNLHDVADNSASANIAALMALRELILSQSGRHLDSAIYWAMVSALHDDGAKPMMRGATAGLLLGSGRLNSQQLGVELAGHLAGLKPRDAVGFLRGITQTARETTWQYPELLKALDALLERWDGNEFVASLPELRLAFAEMTPRETERIAEAVASLHGLVEFGPLVQYDVSPEEVQRNLELTATLREVMAADGLDGWVGAAG
jgi:hypothetical protein